MQALKASKDLLTISYNCFSSPFEFEGATHTLSVSAGIALLEEQQDARQLLEHADWAMYQAKVAGRGCYCIFG